MQPRYKKKQRVKIVSIKYSQKAEYLNESGVILDSFYAGKWGQVDYMSHSPGDYYVYKVRLDKDGSEAMVVEDELEPLKT
jgi:hypothetical protein